MAREFEGVWIPASLWFDKTLTMSEKVLYLEIKSLDNDFGCVATNKKLSESLQLNPTTVSGLLRSLEDKGIIKIEYADYNSFEGRVIRVIFYYPNGKHTPLENPKGGLENQKPPSENQKHSNTISNTFSKEDTKVSNVGLPTSTTTVGSDYSKRCQLFIQRFNNLRRINNKPSKFVSNNTLCGTLKQRLKVYDPNEILEVVKNCIADDFHIKSNFKYVTPEYVLRLKTIEMYKPDNLLSEIVEEIQSKMVY